MPSRGEVLSWLRTISRSQVETKTKADIEEKNKQLRQLVGGSYRLSSEAHASLMLREPTALHLSVALELEGILQVRSL